MRTRRLLSLALAGLLPVALSAQNQWLHFSEAANQSAIYMGDLDVTGDQLTVEALITPHELGGSVVSKHNSNEANYLLRTDRFWVTTSSGVRFVDNPCVLSINSTYHIAGTYDGDSLRYFVNGNQVNAVPCTGTLVQNAIQAAIGNRSNTLDEQYRGYIDEVRVWSVARAQVEIVDNMFDLADPTSETGLRAYFKFEGDHTNAQGDASWNGVVIGAQGELSINPLAQSGQLTTPDCSPCGHRDIGSGEQGVSFVDVSTYSIAGRSDYCEAAIQQTSGRIIMGGWYRTGGGGNAWNWALAGLTAQGQLDSTFGSGGKVKLTSTTLDANSRSYALALDPATQRFYQAGTGREPDNTGPFCITAVRYMPDGTIDSTFSDEGRMFQEQLGSSAANAAAVHDGRLLLAGKAFDKPVCTKYWDDGTPDPFFGNDNLPGLASISDLPGTFSIGQFRDLVIDPSDSSIVAVGHWGQDVLVARFTQEGTLDPSFDGTGWALYDPDGSGYYCLANAVALDDHGRIVLTGTARSDARTLVMRLLSNGQLDPQFGDNGAVIMNPTSYTSRGFDILAQTDCKVIVAGETHTGSTANVPHMLLRFLPNGQLDSTFAVNGVMIDDFPVGANDNGAWKAILWSNTGSLIAAGEGYAQSGTFPDFCAAEYFACTDMSTDCLLVDPTGIVEDQAVNGPGTLRLYPNPTNGTVILILAEQARPNHLTLFDATGRIVLSQPIANNSGPVTMDLSGHESGLYMVQVRFADGTQAVQRVVKE